MQLSSDEERPDPNKHDKFIQLHVSFISRQVNMLITEKVLREVFAAYGEIADVVVKKHSSTVLVLPPALLHLLTPAPAVLEAERIWIRLLL